MKKIILAVFALFLMTISCKKETKMNTDETTIDSTEILIDGHNAMNSLDFEGTYIGSLPCTDCESIETKIILTDDSFIKETIYKGKSKEVIKETGKTQWNKEGSSITLLGLDLPNQYFVGEDILIHLDEKGNSIEGDLALKYILKKETIADTVDLNNKDELKNTKWRLVKLNGKTIAKAKKDEREFGITFATVNKFSGYAGCNNMMGSYELEKLTNISFSKVAMTMMACPDSETEQEFAKVLETVDNYNFDGKSLKLNKAKTSLAEFEIIK